MARKITKELDPTLERIAKEAADETKIPTTQMREAYYLSMELFVKNIRAKRVVLIPNMGLFFISPYKTERLIERMFMSARKRINGEDPKGMTVEQVKEQLKKYWDYHERGKQHYPRIGKKYKARKRREALLREAGDSEQLQQLLERRETKRAPTLGRLLKRPGAIQSQDISPG